MTIDYEKKWKQAKAYGERMGLGPEAEDFAQEVVLRVYQVGTARFEWILSDLISYYRADKRILSSPQGKLSGYRTYSLDAPIDSTDEDSAKLGDVVADSRDQLETIGEFEFYDGLLRDILGLVNCDVARDWAWHKYMEYLERQL